MKNRAEDEELMIQYLLGELPEDEQTRLEELYFTNDEYYEQLLALENELAYDYAQGRLSKRERELFERRFLNSPEEHNRAELAGAFLKKVSGPRPVAADRERHDWKQSLLALLGLQNPVMQLTLAAATLIAMLGVVWLIIETTRLRTELNQAQSERTNQQKELERQATEERSRREQLNQELERERSRRVELEQELAKKQPDQGPQKQEGPAIVSMILAPGLVRESQEPKRMLIPAGVDLLQLQLDIKKGIVYRSYRVVLQTAEGDEVWSQDMLRARPTDTGQAVILKLPARSIPQNDYELTLIGVTPTRELQDVATYYFTIIKK